ncbi:hypothetical protein C1I97_28190 [Streptomyces sp. NTH33]|nr:hypothetical protein C1I97_28190 [Streptomyces sp. NTH33]
MPGGTSVTGREAVAGPDALDGASGPGRSGVPGHDDGAGREAAPGAAGAHRVGAGPSGRDGIPESGDADGSGAAAGAREAPGGTVRPTGRGGVPAPGDGAGREAAPGDFAAHGAPADSGGAAPAQLLLPEECDEFGARLRGAVAGFIDGPRNAVEEADRAVEELAGRFTEALARRRRTLRSAWQDGDGEKAATASATERLRLALRDYRELADRLTRL